MKLFQWKRLLVFVCLVLIVSTVSGLFIGYYQADAATSLHITFGSGGNWKSYFTAYNDCAQGGEGGSTTEFVSQSDGSGSFDPQIRLFKGGLNYVRGSGDIIQIRVQITSTDSMTVNPDGIKVFVGNTTSGIVNGTDAVNCKLDWTNKGDNNYQITEAVLPTTMDSTINVIRIDMPDGGTYKNCVFRLVDVYMGPRSSAPYKKVTYKYNTSPTATTTKEELVVSGEKPKNVPTVSTVSNSSTQLVPKNTWKTGSTTGITANTIKDTKITADTTYIAEYTTQYKVVYHNLKTSYGTDYAESPTEWVTAGGYPTLADDYATDLYSDSTRTARWHLNGWSYNSTIYSPADALKIQVNGLVEFRGSWTEQFYVRMLGPDANGGHTTVLSSNWVNKGLGVSSKWSSLPTVNPVYNNGTAAASSLRYVHTTRDDGKRWLNKDGVSRTPAEVLSSAITMAQDFKAIYDTQYPVRYLNGTTVLETDWVTSGAKTTAFNGTAPTKSGYALVGWVKSTSKNTPAATAAAENPGSSAITAQTYYHARFLSNAFVGSSTNNLVITRSVSLQPGTDKTQHKYRLRIDLYQYGGVITDTANNTVAGAMAGYLKLFDNIKMDFYKNVSGPKVYPLRYLGNGQFESEEKLAEKMASSETGWDARLTAGGTGGYVFEMIANGVNSDGTTSYTQWQSQKHPTSGDTDHRYCVMHFFDKAQYTNATNQGAADLRANFYCREVAGSSANTPRGYKYVIIVDFELDRDGTIGGNNIPLSHQTQNSKLEYYSSLTATSPSRTIKMSSVCTPWPNANVAILYDFCPHDYYMDMYDAQKTHVVASGTMKAENTLVQPGLITILRNRANGMEGENHYLVYGAMYTHGNAPVYARDASKVNDYNKLGLPNTDCNGVRNEKVTITYSVKHLGMDQVVYETKCNPYESAFSSTNKHEDIEVDFLTDHAVSITATVTPMSQNNDSFGRSAVATTWTKTTNSYYFAPRFAVADTSNNINIPLQYENYVGSKFVAKPSVEYGTRTVADNRILSYTAPGLINTNGFYFTFKSSGAYSYQMNNFNAKLINGVQRIPYTVLAVNTPKRFDSTATMENRDTVQRYAYIFPSTAITYDQNALTFDVPGNWTKTGIVSQAFQYYNRANGSAGKDRYGFDSNWVKATREGTGNVQIGNLQDYNGGSLYTNVDANARNEWGIFTFTGTGFDLYSRNGPDTGILVAQVYEGNYTASQLSGKTPLQNIFADTYLADKTYYQVPSIQWRATNTDGALKHGTYTVRFRAYYHEAFDHELYKSGATKAPMTEAKILDIMGWDDSVPCSISLSDAAYPALTRATATGDYNVFVDGIRVYNTLGTLSQAASTVTDIFSDTPNAAKYAAYNIYNRDKEVNPKYFNVSEYLVDAQRTDWFKELGTYDASGVLYIAANGSTAKPTDEYVGFHIGMSGQVNTEASDYTDSSGNKYIKYYFLDANGSRIKDKNTGKNIFQYSKDNKYYLETSPWTVLTNNQLNLALGNKISFYDDKYDAIGPEFEIYLTKGNGVAFNVTSSASTVTAVHISLRSANGEAIIPQVYNGTTKAWDTLTVSYATDYTEQYYDVTSYVKSNSGNLYFRNNGGVLSILNVKVVGGNTPSVNTRMMMEALEIFRAESENPILDDGLELKHSLNLASDISVNYVVPAASLEGLQSSYLTVEVPQYEGNELIGSETVTITPVLNGSMYYYTLNGLTAVRMNDELKATLHFVKDGVNYVSNVDSYSIATYAYTQLNKEDASESLKTLCANLLRYGAAAQTFKGYRTDALADEELSALHSAYLTDLETVTFGTTNSVLSDLEAPSVLWKGKVLDLESKVAIKFVIDPTNYEGDAEALSLRVTYLNGDGEEETAILTESELYAEGQPYRAFVFNDLLAAELRTVLSAAVYEGETQVSQTLQYAADAYGNGKTGDLGTLCKALFAYVDVAKAFFAN